MTEEEINVPSYWSAIFTRALFYKLVRWAFVWIIALLPSAFVFYRQLIVEGGLNIDKMCSTGELFIVSIVMVAEPLGDLVMNKARNSLSLVFALIIIIVLVSASYFFCIIEMNEERIRKCNGDHAEYITEGHNYCACTHENETTPTKNNLTHQGNNNAPATALLTGRDTSLVDNEAKNNLLTDSITDNKLLSDKGHTNETEKGDNFVVRIKDVSIITLIWSFIIGLLTIAHSHALKERMR